MAGLASLTRTPTLNDLIDVTIGLVRILVDTYADNNYGPTNFMTWMSEDPLLQDTDAYYRMRSEIYNKMDDVKRERKAALAANKAANEHQTAAAQDDQAYQAGTGGQGSLKKLKTQTGGGDMTESAEEQESGSDNFDGGNELGQARELHPPVFMVSSRKLLTISLPVLYNGRNILEGFGLCLKSISSSKLPEPVQELRHSVWVQNLLLVDVDMFLQSFRENDCLIQSPQ
jgi:hypothetical protein